MYPGYLLICENPQTANMIGSVKHKPANCHICGRSANRTFFVRKFAFLRFAKRPPMPHLKMKGIKDDLSLDFLWIPQIILT